MGKLKKNSRSSRHRANPLIQKPQEEKQDENLRINKVLPLINKLSSTAINDRSMALSAISVMVDDSKFRRILLKEKLLQIVMEQLLNESNSEIIVEAFGLLRNLVIEEGYDVAIYLWRKNIWKTIEVNFDKAKIYLDAYVKDPKKSSKVEVGLLFDFIENLISLVIGLANSSDDVFQQIMNNIFPLISFIKQVLELAVDLPNKNLKVSVSLFNAILEFIYDFSSQSFEFIETLDSKWSLNLHSLYEFVKEVKRCNELSGVYIQGINLQILEASKNLSNKNEQLIQIFTKTINNIKNINIEPLKEILITEIDNSKIDKINKITKERIQARSKYQAIDLTIEIITAAIEIVAFDENFEKQSLKSQNFNDELLKLLTNSVPEVLIHLTKHIEFRSRALTALNNLSWLFITINLISEEWINATKLIWFNLLQINNAEIEEKVSIFGILWAIILVYGDNLSELTTSINMDYISQLIQEFQIILSNIEIDNELKDEYLTRLIGLLGTLAKLKNHISQNKLIGDLFLETLNSLPKVSSKLIIEILDIFYEIYCDSSFDYDEPVFIQGQYLSKLEQLFPKIKTSVKLIDKNIDPELKVKAEEVFINLSRFIQYKKDEGH